MHFLGVDDEQPIPMWERLFALGSLVFLVLLLPVVVCAVYRVADLGFPGWWVLATVPINVFLLPVLAVWAVLRLTTNRYLNALAIASAVVVGLACAMVGISIWVGLGWVFGLPH